MFFLLTSFFPLFLVSQRTTCTAGARVGIGFDRLANTPKGIAHRQCYNNNDE